MSAIWSPYVFGPLLLVSVVLLGKSISGLIAVYTSGPRVEWVAQSPVFDFSLDKTGIYEIAVKRSAIFSAIPRNVSFQVSNRQTGAAIAVDSYTFLNLKRTDMSGNRIVPIAELTFDQPGTFRVLNASTDRFTETDKLMLAPKAGVNGVLLILATVSMGILTIASLVLFTLSLINK
ncbi:hypothetical protein GCM10028805_08060 [Spirosoma harenae]